MDENQIQIDQTQAQAPMQQETSPAQLSQDQVNKIVAREKMQARESGRREAEEKYQREIESMNAQRVHQPQSNHSSSHVDSILIDQKVQEGLERQLARLDQEMKERQLKDQMSKVAGDYFQKIEQGKSAYSDFDEVTEGFDPKENASLPLVYHLSKIDNGGDVLYDLSKNPSKLANIQVLLHTNPKIAEKELSKLSKSISENRQSQADAQNQNVSDPLDRIQSSRVSGSNGKMGVRDLRDQPWLKG